ncbi:MAG TPA: hypothetical protein VFS49_05035, partial [Croceibacterium sp.]|nr:hypothetical protein [Croceibacterium sp.]
RFEHEMSALQIFSERDVAAPKKVATPTLGFEFDLNYGVNRGVFDARKADMPAAATFPPEYAKLTRHEGRDGAGKIVDGFTVSRDGPRFEISTVPFAIANDAEFSEISNKVIAFGTELEAAAKTVDRAISVPGIKGHPVRFEHPKTLIDRLPIIVHQVGSAKLGTLRFPSDAKLTASPQATIALPLGKIADLIGEITRSRTNKVKRDDLALTGPPAMRLGLRTDLAVIARDRVLASVRRQVGTMLLDGTTLTKADLSPALVGLLTLVVMYLLTGVIVDSRDDKAEDFAKGRLPINLKTPFWQVFQFALSERERVIFRQLYANANVRTTLYRLADRSATRAAGKRRLFPRDVHWDLDRLHDQPLTWDGFIEHILSGEPLRVTKANTLLKPKHALGDEILVAPLSSKINFSKTDPLIAVELRRIGFQALPLAKWGKLMEQLRDMARRLNA